MENQTLSSTFYDNEILYGKDKEECIVAAHTISDSRLRLYFRKNDSITFRDEPYYPFFFYSDENLLKTFQAKQSGGFWNKKLEGNNYYNNLAIFKNNRDYRDAINFIGETNKEKIYDKGDSAAHYFYQTGKTMFKGMTFNELRRMQLDIETYFVHKEFGKDKIIIVAMSDNTGWEKIIHIHNRTEKAMLEELVTIIRERDPDVIEGHNIYAFDIAYIERRCILNHVAFAIGRDGSIPRSFPSSIRFAERTMDFPCYEIAGRHVIDTFFLAQLFDIAKRTLPSYGLKEVAKYFGFASENREYIDHKDIAKTWDTDRERLLRYALDDVRETGKISEMLLGSYFYLTQMLPYSLGTVARTGPAQKIESLFIRNYLHQKRSIPKSQIGQQQIGGYTRVFYKGILGPIVYADVESLYPSIMLSYNIYPRTDELQLFSKLLSNLKDLRFWAKDKMKEAKPINPKESEQFDAMQNSFKILINSMYGYLGYSKGIFNDYSAADKVTSTGQEIAKRMIREFEVRGSKIIEVDTDGIFLIPPSEINTEEKEKAFVEEVSKTMPKGIQIGFDGRFKKMVSYKKKNYILLDYKDKMKIKGSSLVSRSMEKFGRDFVKAGFEKLLQEDVDGLRELYLNCREKIITKKINISDFSKTESLKKTMDEYKLHTKDGKNKMVIYEIAIRNGLQVTKGNRLTYYIGGSSQGANAENGKLAEQWNEKNPDQNTEFYLNRLYDFTEKFIDFFAPSDFRSLFSVDELFGVDTSTIKLIKEISFSDTEEEEEEN